MNKIDEEIKALRLEISLNEEVSKEILTNSIKDNSTYNDLSTWRISSMRKYPETLERAYTKAWLSEMELRKAISHLKTSFFTNIKLLHARIEKNKKEIKSIKMEYAGGLEDELKMVNDIHAEKLKIIENILHLRDKEYKQNKDPGILESRRQEAAIKIQTWWRAYEARKRCHLSKFAPVTKKPKSASKKGSEDTV